MCGITAFYSYNTIQQHHLDKLHLANHEMIYRGPDEQDVWFRDNVALAQVRLSIIGISNGHQPLFNEDKTLALVCNGEIYNYKSLKIELIEKGHIFSTDSDSEVIIHLFEEYGQNLCEKLDGMFAFCLYNLCDGSLIVARDRAGKKPLYYAYTREGIVFSSELKIIKNHFLNEVFINYEVLRQIQQYSYSISLDETYVKGIYKVPFACSTIVTQKSSHLNFRKYYKRRIEETFSGTYQEACREVKRLLFQAVEKRLQSEVPVAILLSAGIDSSAIASIAREMTENVNVISAGYKGKHEVDERAEAKRLCDEKKFIWHEVELDESDFIENLDQILSRIDEPNGDVAMFAQWRIYEQSKHKGYKVLLSGNGGDELFYGYKVHNNYALGLKWLKANAKHFPMYSSSDASKFFFKQFLKLKFNKEEFMLDKININMEFPVMEELNHLASIPLRRADWHRIDFRHELDNVYYFLHYAWLTNNCYFLADKLAMAHSVEVRSPFADLDLINFVDTLPIQFKFKEGQPKQLLKDSLKGVLPDYVINRKKSGFTPPMAFVEKLINEFQKKHFQNSPQNFPQLVTDYFASQI
jgi:asparagine synthase (glutamine-hydrolysing)